VAIIGILSAIAVPLYAGVQSRARIAKAQADIGGIGSSIAVYSAHCGVLPPVGVNAGANCPAGVAGAGGVPTVLTRTQTIGGLAAGPFLNTLPAPPAGWAAYVYTPAANGTFQVSATASAADGGLTYNAF
jgi:type II secretory pathway pseudopilin PulG